MLLWPSLKKSTGGFSFEWLCFTKCDVFVVARQCWIILQKTCHLISPDRHHIYLTRSLGFLKLLGQKLQQLANFGSVSSSTALSLISLILSLSAADWARIRSDTEASSPGSFASSAACSSVKVMISKPLLFDVFCPDSSSSSTTSWLSRYMTEKKIRVYYHNIVSCF